MRAIFIDPASKTVTAIDTTGDPDDLYRLLGCASVDSVSVTMGEILYIDDEGLMADEPGPFFALDGHDDPLPGRGIILGLDVYGKHHGSHMRVVDAAAMISWPDVELVGFAPISDGGHETGHRPIFRKKEQH